MDLEGLWNSMRCGGREMEHLSTVAAELRGRGYSWDTALAVDEFYEDERLPEGGPREQADVIEARLHRIYPERYLHDRFEDAAVNRAYSTVCNVMKEQEGGIVPRPFYGDLEVSAFKDIDAIYLDHSAIYTVTDRSNWQAGIAPGHAGDASMVGWDRVLALLDDVLKWNEEPGFDVDIRFPGDLREKAQWAEGARRQMAYEVCEELERIGTPFDIPDTPDDIPPGLEYAEEDVAIAEQAERESDQPLVLTFDYDFKHLEDHKDILARPPDVAHLVLQVLFELRTGTPAVLDGGIRDSEAPVA